MNSRTWIAALLLASAAALAGPSATEQQLIAAETAWNQAFVDADLAALEKMYAEEYLFTDHDGQTYDRAGELDAVRSGDFKMTSFRLDDLKVHAYKGFGTVMGIIEFSGSYKGDEVSRRYRFTDVFVKRQGRWQAVASHVSQIAATT